MPYTTRYWSSKPYWKLDGNSVVNKEEKNIYQQNVKMTLIQAYTVAKPCGTMD